MSERKKLLAIDPGSTESAYVIWDGEAIREKAKIDNLSLLNRCYQLGYDEMVIELVASYGMPVGESIFTTCLWSGRFIEAVSMSKKLVGTIYRKDIKLHLCGSCRAKDSNIRQRLIDLLGTPGTKRKPGITYGCTKDIWSALAIAVTYSQIKH